MEIMELIDQLETLAQNATRIPVTGRAIVDPDQLFDLVDAMREALPTEIREAARLMRERDTILGSAHTQARQMLEEARNQAERLTDEHQVRREAEQKAQEILQEAYQERREIIKAGLERVAELLSSVDRVFEQMMQSVKEAQELMYRTQLALENARNQVEQWRAQLDHRA